MALCALSDLIQKDSVDRLSRLHCAARMWLKLSARVTSHDRGQSWKVNRRYHQELSSTSLSPLRSGPPRLSSAMTRCLGSILIRIFQSPSDSSKLKCAMRGLCQLCLTKARSISTRCRCTPALPYRCSCDLAVSLALS